MIALMFAGTLMGLAHLELDLNLFIADRKYACDRDFQRMDIVPTLSRAVSTIRVDPINFIHGAIFEVSSTI